jgi:chloramphenicol-sensitive protein RarD
MNPASEARAGFWATFSAFFLWGLFPLYWHELRMVPAGQIVAHRILWCTLLVGGYLSVRRGSRWVGESLKRPRVPLLLACSSVLISLNLGLYVWAVNHGHVVDSSLGYFINPLVNVLLGVAVLGERLNPAQYLSVALAAAGVSYLTWQLGAPPYIALALALSFGGYGLIRKIAAVEAIPGLGIEGLFLVLPALAYLLWEGHRGTGAFGTLPAYPTVLLIAGGAITALPLIFFAYGARRIPLSLVGILQYTGPTLQLLTGIVVFKEPFTHVQAIGYSLIWSALVVYAGDGLLRARASAAAAAPT